MTKSNNLARFRKYAAASRSVKQAAAEAKPIDIKQETAREQKIKNDNAEQDIKLKYLTLRLLFGFLIIETLVIFLFTYFQAIGSPGGFNLEEWSFRTVIGATILQITGMLLVAVQYLFPKK